MPRKGHSPLFSPTVPKDKDLVSELDSGNVAGEAADAGSRGSQQYHLLSVRRE